MIKIASNKFRVKNLKLNNAKNKEGKALTLNAVKIIPLNDSEELEVGAMVTIVNGEDVDGNPTRTETRRLHIGDFEHDAPIANVNA